MKLLLSTGIVLLSLSASTAFASETPEFELVCRMKAKEVAAQTYRGCVTDARTTQIEQLKKEYQDKLKSMKDDYERELKKLSASGRTTKELLSEKAKRSSKKISRAFGKSGNNESVVISPTASSVDTLDEVQVQLKPAPTSPINDESMMDLPEPSSLESNSSL